jgi:hypothetical protein
MRVNPIFWSIAAIDAVLFVGIIVSILMQGGGANSSGGREMGLAFFGALPLLVLGVAVLIFVNSQSSLWKGVALLIVAGPGLFMAGNQIHNLYIDYLVRQNALGRSYFEGKAFKSMGEAVVKGDTAAIVRLARDIDVNAVGKRNVTLISLAAERLFEASTPERANQELEVVKTLLELGAKPGPALEAAVKVKDPAFLEALLAAGADPNMGTAEGHPGVFGWVSVMPLANLRLLISHGLKVNVMEREIPLTFTMAVHERWDLLAEIAEHGADLTVKREDDGRTAVGEVARRIEEARNDGRDPSPDLLRVQALLNAKAAAPNP